MQSNVRAERPSLGFAHFVKNISRCRSSSVGRTAGRAHDVRRINAVLRMTIKRNVSSANAAINYKNVRQRNITRSVHRRKSNVGFAAGTLFPQTLLHI
jgi:hypothetical protein